MFGVKTPLDPERFLQRFLKAAEDRGFRADWFARINGLDLPALSRPAVRPDAPRIYLSAGIHGDEPAGMEALLALLESGEFDDRAGWWLVPVINPAGLALGTRDDALGRDLNRDFKDLRTPEVAGLVGWLRRQPDFTACGCLHEDWEAQGFYLYELNPDDRPTLAPAMLAAAGQLMPIEAGDMIDGRPVAEPGIIRPVNDPLERVDWPEAIYLRAHHTSLSYTLETPSGLPLGQRVAALTAAVRAGLHALLCQ
ncbi:MAG: M14 family metallocarboxypeptidase [Verrucomicrobiota bacterium]